MSELLFWVTVGLASAAGLAVVAATFALLLPLRLHLHALARGEPSGAWALAAGLRVGPLALSMAALRGARATLQVHLFSRRIFRRELRELIPEGQEPREPEVEERGPSLVERYRALSRWLDPEALLVQLLEERRHLRVRELEVELDYAFQDVALTGQLYGALCTLAGVLPERFRLISRPSWRGQSRASVVARGSLEIGLGRILLDLLIHLIKGLKIRNRSAQPSSIELAEKSYG